MNLSLEYFSRNLTAKNFLKIPCNLFLQNKINSKKLLVSLENNFIDENKSLIVKHWHIGKHLKKDKFYIKIEDVFTHPFVIVPGMTPIRYQEQTIKFDSNFYNHPIEQQDFDLISNNFLNSVAHRSYKKDWLWDGFTHLYFEGMVVPDKMYLPALERRHIIEQEKKYIKIKNPIFWKKWKHWLSRFITDDKIATELVFLSFFKTN